MDRSIPIVASSKLCLAWIYATTAPSVPIEVSQGSHSPSVSPGEGEVCPQYDLFQSTEHATACVIKPLELDSRT
jgi:hypothetical protein